MNDKSREGVYRWSDGSLAEFTAWDEDEPDERDDHDCVLMRAYTTWKWSDYKCGSTATFICELGIDFTL